MHKRLSILAVAASIVMPLAADIVETNAVKTTESEVSAMEPRVRPVRRDSEKLEVVASSVAVVDMAQPAETVQPTVAPTIAEVSAVAIANASSAQVPAIVSVALAQASEAEVPAIFAALEAKISSMKVEDVKRLVEVAVRDKWYDRYVAESGSMLYWILRIAKERASQGKNVDVLESKFYSTLQKWAQEAN